MQTTKLNIKDTEVTVNKCTKFCSTGFSFDLSELNDKELDVLFTSTMKVITDRLKKEYANE